MSNDAAKGLSAVNPALLATLDVVRFALALMVAVGHWTQPYFQDVWPNLTEWAVMSVGAFFVISGFTIRMLYQEEQGFSFRRYSVERWSRILSVALPALFVSGLLDFTSWTVAPAYYEENWGFGSAWPVDVLLNALGLAQVWGHNISPFSNSPFWSLSYELGFYVVFGLWMASWRIAAVIALIAYGPNIAVMLPLWLAGAVLFDIFCTGSAKNPARRLWLLIGIVVVGLAALWAARLQSNYRLMQFFDLINIKQQHVDGPLVQGAIAFFVLFAVLAFVLQGSYKPSPNERRGGVTRYLGNISFPLYLFHFPLLVLCGSLAFYDRSSVVQLAATFIGVLGVIAVLSPLTDSFKRVLRKGIDRVWGAGQGVVGRLRPARP